MKNEIQLYVKIESNEIKLPDMAGFFPKVVDYNNYMQVVGYTTGIAMVVRNRGNYIDNHEFVFSNVGILKMKVDVEVLEYIYEPMMIVLGYCALPNVNNLYFDLPKAGNKTILNETKITNSSGQAVYESKIQTVCGSNSSPIVVDNQSIIKINELNVDNCDNYFGVFSIYAVPESHLEESQYILLNDDVDNMRRSYYLSASSICNERTIANWHIEVSFDSNNGAENIENIYAQSAINQKLPTPIMKIGNTARVWQNVDTKEEFPLEYVHNFRTTTEEKLLIKFILLYDQEFIGNIVLDNLQTLL